MYGNRAMALRRLVAATFLALATCEAFVCVLPNPSPNPPALPQLPVHFTTEVEGNIENRGYTVNVVEYYDGPNDRGRLDISGARGGDRTLIYTFADMQYFRLTRVPGSTSNVCTAHTISANAPFNPFGPVFVNGTAHIRGVADLLHFGRQYGEVYAGAAQVRGIDAYRWSACANTSLGGNMSVDWYFSSANWSSHSPYARPLRVVVEGVDPSRGRNASGSPLPPHYFKHTYDFINFEAGSPDPTVFQIPPGTFCSGSRPAKYLPQVPDRFSARFEVIMSRSISYHNEFFDPKGGIMFMDGFRGGGDRRNHERNRLHGIHSVYQDLNLGLAYVFANTSDCLVVNVSSLTYEHYPMEHFWTVPSESEPSHLSLRTIREMWGFSNNVTYVGTRTVNNVVCDVWQEERGHGNFTRVFEISFSKPSLAYRLFPGTPPEYQVPVLMEVYPKRSTGFHFHRFVNLFDVNFSPPKPQIDLLKCYKRFKTVWFLVQVPYGNVTKNLEEFKSSIVSSLYSSAKVHQSRLTNVQAIQNNEDNNVTIVQCTVLDKPGVPTYQDTGASIDAAVANLKTAINSRQGVKISFGSGTFSVVRSSFITSPFFFPTTSRPGPSTLSPKVSQAPVSQRPGSGSSQRFSAGIMAGVSVATLVCGIVIGALVIYVLMKRQRGPFQYKSEDL